LQYFVLLIFNDLLILLFDSLGVELLQGRFR
jgi:hypothetical protein